MINAYIVRVGNLDYSASKLNADKLHSGLCSWVRSKADFEFPLDYREEMPPKGKALNHVVRKQ